MPVQSYYYKYVWLPIALLGLNVQRLLSALLFRTQKTTSIAAWSVIIFLSYVAGNQSQVPHIAYASSDSSVMSPAQVAAGEPVVVVTDNPSPSIVPESKLVLSATPAPAANEPQPVQISPSPTPIVPSLAASPKSVAAVKPASPARPAVPSVSLATSPVQYANTYAFGQCTYYAASRRAIPSYWGNANSWFYNARAGGWRVGYVPAVHAIAWTSVGSFGHVAFVEQVSGSQVYISEMNFNGNWNRVTYRWVAANSFGYIY